jgi:hypothetical protein
VYIAVGPVTGIFEYIFSSASLNHTSLVDIPIHNASALFSVAPASR